MYRGNCQAAARRLGFPVAYMKRWYQQMKELGHVNDKPRSGRPSVFPAAATEAVVTKVLELQSFPAAIKALVAAGVLPANISHSTVYKKVMKLWGHRLRWGRQKYTPNLNPATKQRRLAFAKLHQDAKTNFCATMAIDSCIFRLDRVGGKNGVWQLVGSHDDGQPSYVKQGSLHVYAGITAWGKTPLVFASGTTLGAQRKYYSTKGTVLKGVGAAEFQDILEHKLVPAAEDIFDAVGLHAWQLLMDRAPAHAATSTQEWLQRNGVSVVQGWPGNSPDLNPIENLWGWMKAKLYKKKVQNIHQLKAALLELWDTVPVWMLSKLMGSMDRRLDDVVARQGGYTGR
jgi:transposase